MANKNVYIGNRYIPKHCGNWDSSKTTSYESLSVVYWEGKSYTSKQNVPIGIEIDNNNFWVSSADYNEQVAIYENNVQEYHKFVIDGFNEFKKEVQNIVTNVKSFGAKGDGVTDDTQAIQNAINQCSNKTLYIPSGTFCISKQLTIDNDCCLEMERNAIIKATTAIDIMLYFTGNGTAGYARSQKPHIHGGCFNANGLAQCCIQLNKYMGFELFGTYFKECPGKALMARPGGIDSVGGYGNELIAKNLSFTNDKDYAGSIAIFNNSNDAEFDSCIIRNFTTAIITLNGRFSHCHGWVSSSNIFKNSYFAINEAASTFVNCYSDTYQTPFASRGGECKVIGCQVAHNSDLIPSSIIQEYPITIFKRENSTIISGNGLFSVLSIDILIYDTPISIVNNYFQDDNYYEVLYSKANKQISNLNFIHYPTLDLLSGGYAKSDGFTTFDSILKPGSFGINTLIDGCPDLHGYGILNVETITNRRGTNVFTADTVLFCKQHFTPSLVPIKNIYERYFVSGAWTPWVNIMLIQSGTTATRPHITHVKVGTMFYDTTLDKPIWWNGTLWKDSNGTTV